MAGKKSLHELVQSVGRYPEVAFNFIGEGLKYTAQRRHGKLNEHQRALRHFMDAHQIDYFTLKAKYEAQELPGEVLQAIDKAGGVEAVNFHVTGEQLCWGLRNYALRRWGLLATTVLRTWGITETLDFGRIVFALVENGDLLKQPTDTLEDFEDVFDFEEACDKAYRIPARIVSP